MSRKEARDMARPTRDAERPYRTAHQASARKKTQAIVYHVCVASFAFFMLYPVLWLLASSFKANVDIFQYSHSLIPQTWQFENYVQGWRGFGGVTFTTFFKNSF